MSLETYLEALQLVESMSSHVTLGGGEPTVHKDFFLMLDKAIEYYRRGRLELPPFVITNGKLKSKALRLVAMAERGLPVGVELSQDQFHDPIHHDVVWAFGKHEEIRAQRRRSWQPPDPDTPDIGVRTVSGLVAVGRAADHARGLCAQEGCCCSDLLIAPNGDIYPCGCKKVVIGNVHDRNLDLSWYEQDLGHQCTAPGQYREDLI